MSIRHMLSKRFRDLFLAKRSEANPEGSNQIQADRESIHKALRITLDKLVETAPGIIVPSKVLEENAISVARLLLRSDGGRSFPNPYFIPWNLAELEEYSLDINEPFTMKRVEGTEKVWQRVDKDQDDLLDPPAELLCSILTYEIWLARVKQREQMTTSLKAVRDMRYGGLDDEILQYHWTERFICGDPIRAHPRETRCLDVDTWFYGHEIDKHPHLTVTLSHDRSPTEDIFYNKLIPLIAIMITQLELPALSDHLIIPLNVLSCFNYWKARILQVHLTSEGLMVYKSELFDFSNPETRRDYVKLFTLTISVQ